MPERELGRPLIERLERVGRHDADAVLDGFLGWVSDQGLVPYPAQEEALLELMADRHVILGTPTGSGKSLVALALHWKALCEGARSFYTAPIKALASQKFFALCEQLGPENVGMLTGDASINPDAPVICCTAEVLENMALRQGASLRAPYVVMDEFHFYADPDRGHAWQVPLLCLPRTTFLLMSATLGDMRAIRDDLEARSGRAVAVVESDVRPVPLDYEYAETPLHETVEGLIERGKAPIYVVSFTQRECAELAGGLVSANLCTREERAELRRAVGDFRFDSAYGKDMRRFIGAGVGLHHAGLLPRYRLLVEQLSQRALLKVIAGTDTLGVGVNIPIRTVLFTKLAKFDGREVGLLKVREFKQIAGRAGRKGFDERGSVACQAPAWVIEARRRRRGGRAARRSGVRPPRGAVGWGRDTFQSMIERRPETLVSRFRVSHGMVVSVLRREERSDDASRPYRALIALIDTSHGSPRRKHRLRRDAARLVRGLRQADVVEVRRDPSGRRRLAVSGDLQWDFSLHHALSLYLVDASGFLDREDPAYALDLLSLVEAILEDPRAILHAQLRRLRDELLNTLKAERVPYEERMRLLDQVELPQPNAEFIGDSFAYFAERHPWVQRDDVRLKSIAREIYEGYASFEHYVRQNRLQRVEGVLLRYLSQVYTTLVQTVPETARTDAVEDLIAFLRVMLASVDSSLLEEWESRLEPAAVAAGAPQRDAHVDPAADPRVLTARIRAELHRLLRVLAARDFDEAALCTRPAPDDAWDAARFERALAPYFKEYDALEFSERARHSEFTRIERSGPRQWRVSQTLLDPADDRFWCLEGEVDLRDEPPPGSPLFRLLRIGT